MFPWIQSNLNLEMKKRLIFEIFQTWAKYSILEQIPRLFRYLKHLQAIDRSFATVTKLLRYEITEIFCEGLK